MEPKCELSSGLALLAATFGSLSSPMKSGLKISLFELLFASDGVEAFGNELEEPGGVVCTTFRLSFLEAAEVLNDTMLLVLELLLAEGTEGMALSRLLKLIGELAACWFCRLLLPWPSRNAKEDLLVVPPEELCLEPEALVSNETEVFLDRCAILKCRDGSSDWLLECDSVCVGGRECECRCTCGLTCA